MLISPGVASGQLAGRLRLPAAPLDAWLLGAVVALAWSLLGLHVFARLGSGMDLAILDQGVSGLSELHAPVSTVKGLGCNLWGDHFHPVIVLLVPLRWLWADPRALVVGQAVALAVACGVLCRCTARLVDGGRGRAAGLVLGGSLACAAGTQAGMLFDVHEVALGMPLLALALSALLEGRPRAFTAWALSLLLVKEDAGLLVFGLGMVAVLRGARLLGVVLCAIATGWTLLVIEVVIPAIGHGPWTYGGRLPGPRDGMHNLVAALCGTPDNLLLTVLVLAGAGCWLALRSSLLVVLLPSLAMRALSGVPAYTGLGFHYNLLPQVVICFATLDVLRRTRRPGDWCVLVVVVAVLSAVLGPAGVEVRRPVDPVHTADGRTALAVVPAGEPVAGDAYLVAQLVGAHPITQLIRPHRETSGATSFDNDLARPLAVRWVVLDEDTRADLDDGGNWVPGAEHWFRTQGFRVERRVGSFVVLHRP